MPWWYRISYVPYLAAKNTNEIIHLFQCQLRCYCIHWVPFYITVLMHKSIIHSSFEEVDINHRRLLCLRFAVHRTLGEHLIFLAYTIVAGIKESRLIWIPTLCYLNGMIMLWKQKCDSLSRYPEYEDSWKKKTWFQFEG